MWVVAQRLHSAYPQRTAKDSKRPRKRPPIHQHILPIDVPRMRAAQECAGGTELVGAAQAAGGVFGDAGLADGVGIAAVALGLGGKVAG